MGKKLNLFDLISIGIGVIIGAGVFSVMGYGIAYTGRSIVLALIISMVLVILQSIRDPILANVFVLDGGTYGFNALLCPRWMTGIYAANDVIFKLGTQSVTALAFVKYLCILIPALSDYEELSAIVVLSLAMALQAFGDKAVARVQNVMCIMMYIALALFVVFGVIHINPSAYAGEPFMINGISGFMMAAALMSYTCNGFQYLVNLTRSAENPKRNIPLAFVLSALIASGIYALIGFAATHTNSYADIAGKSLGDISKFFMPNALSMYFIVGGALFALGTSLVGGMASCYQPLVASATDGWLPRVLAKFTKKHHVPYALIFLYIVGVAVLILGFDLNDFITMSLVPLAIVYVITNVFSLNAPERFAKEWKESGIKVSSGLYKFLLILGTIASAILGCYCFLSNNFKIVTIVLVCVIIIYGMMMNRFGKIEIHAKDDYQEKA